ncbi:DedA family protein [Acidomonas methanolica]|uniref:DedA family protein n=1 Tax=Acidomonas methanolica TaxID=437 RepID=UPI00211A0E99|nr:VTT domain-containing protein [Acidomonas methanolica]MCQ9154582.1 VTT domain-containing protein [Acidomonas methanolica]
MSALWTTIRVTIEASWAAAAWWLKAFWIILGTFVLEDATTILAAMASAQGRLAIPLALGALYVGVAAGDCLLYAMGALGKRWHFWRRFLTLPKHEHGHKWFVRNVVRVVVVSRFIPGARLPLYTAAGFFAAPFRAFALSAVSATLVWTTLLFGVSLHVGTWMNAHLDAWRWVGMIGFMATILFVGRVIARFQTYSD